MRALVFGTAWWALSEGVHYHIWLAAGIIVAAVWASMSVAPPSGAWRLSVGGTARFAAYFLARSTLAGIDVARRALHPSLPVHPGWIRYRTTLPSGGPRAFFMAVISLLPGTLNAGGRGDEIRIHVLDLRDDVRSDLEMLEHRVADLFKADRSFRRTEK